MLAPIVLLSLLQSGRLQPSVARSGRQAGTRLLRVGDRVAFFARPSELLWLLGATMTTSRAYCASADFSRIVELEKQKNAVTHLAPRTFPLAGRLFGADQSIAAVLLGVVEGRQQARTSWQVTLTANELNAAANTALFLSWAEDALRLEAPTPLSLLILSRAKLSIAPAQLGVGEYALGFLLGCYLAVGDVREFYACANLAILDLVDVVGDLHQSKLLSNTRVSPLDFVRMLPSTQPAASNSAAENKRRALIQKLEHATRRTLYGEHHALDSDDPEPPGPPPPPPPPGVQVENYLPILWPMDSLANMGFKLRAEGGSVYNGTGPVADELIRDVQQGAIIERCELDNGDVFDLAFYRTLE